MINFKYLLPRTLEEALGMISQYNGKSRLLAGGTDLLVEMRSREMHPEAIIDLKGITGLDYIDYNASTGLRIGALTRIHDIETSPVIREKFGLLSQGASVLGSVQVRNKATIGGNLCHAAPSADTAPPLCALGAMARIVGPDGEQVVPVEDLFTGPGMTCLNNDQILVEFQVPNMAAHTEGVYLKFSPRRAMDLAVVGIASVLTTDSGVTTCSDAHIVMGAVAPTPMRAIKAEAVLKGKKLDSSIIAEAAKLASEEAKPISDIRSSEWYRRQIVEVLVQRSINQVVDKLKAVNQN